MDQAVEELKQRATVRDAKAQAYYEEKLKERQRKEQETGKKPSGRAPKPPKTGAENSNEQANLTDADARIMRKNKRAGLTESYNAQAAVDADGSQLIVGEHVSQSASDSTELENGINSIPAEVLRNTTFNTSIKLCFECSESFTALLNQPQSVAYHFACRRITPALHLAGDKLFKVVAQYK